MILEEYERLTDHDATAFTRRVRAARVPTKMRLALGAARLQQPTYSGRTYKESINQNRAYARISGICAYLVVLKVFTFERLDTPAKVGGDLICASGIKPG